MFDPRVRAGLLEKGMASHSSILAWEIPRTEEPGGLKSMGAQRSDTAERLTRSLPLSRRSQLVLDRGRDGLGGCHGWARDET